MTSQTLTSLSNGLLQIQDVDAKHTKRSFKIMYTKLDLRFPRPKLAVFRRSILLGIARIYDQLNANDKAMSFYKRVLVYDSMNAEALACLASSDFYSDKPEVFPSCLPLPFFCYRESDREYYPQTSNCKGRSSQRKLCSIAAFIRYKS